MIETAELRRMAETRQGDAVILYRAGRYDAAMYLGGYAVELALKARICDTLRWSRFPSERGEFRNYQSLQTHDLNVLLDFSGVQNRVRREYAAAWSIVRTWTPQWRYFAIGSATEGNCLELIEAVDLLLEVI